MRLVCWISFLLLSLTSAFAQEHWQPMPIVRQDIVDRGVSPGGEGCQRIQCVAVDPVDGSLILIGTDVGGMYRSLDGGKTFSSCNTGYSSTGVSGFAIDPKNTDRILAVGDNAGKPNVNGIYLSTDRGASWEHVLPKSNRGRDEWRPIVYDPTSYDEALGYCLIAYWAQELNKDEQGGHLYKTVDGGYTWDVVASGKAYGGGNKQRLLAVHPTKGALYIANKKGLHISVDGGESFTRTFDKGINGLSMIPSQPDSVWISTPTQVLYSEDRGVNFTAIESTGMDSFYRIAVSPVNPQNMAAATVQRDGRERYYSNDGGRTWQMSERDLENSWIPEEIIYGGKAIQVVWHPLDESVAFAVGPGDMITRTDNAGKTFRWNNNGNNGIMLGGHFNFSSHNPDIMYFGSQDYNGALTMNRGETWNFINLSISNTRDALREGGDDSDPWGFVYGGYSPDGKTIFGGNKEYQGKGFDLWITFDGGKTSERKVKGLKGIKVSYSDPTDPDVLFCWNHRSENGGQTWRKMNGCQGVFTANLSKPSELYGADGNKIVRSKNHGRNWRKVATLPKGKNGRIVDLAYDHVNDRFWVATKGNRLFRCDGPDYEPVAMRNRLPKDQLGEGMMCSTVAVDPINPNIVYVGANGTGLFFQRNNAVARSVDGGKTWERLTCNPKYAGKPGETGAQMASSIRVHPVTRELWSGSCCYGFWRIGPPEGEETSISLQ